MDASSSSKVTVEYHDPSGVFSLVSSDIVSRLPLRNLNWQSPSRPLRQIKSLHLDFVPDRFTSSGSPLSSQRLDGEGTTSFDIVRSGADQRKNAVTKERRHQIPGLQTSPYLKVYVLRCDDKDTYKATERKKIREWIRKNATINTKGRGENHDAFEWMILHVVIPYTLAASEPRWREAASKDPEEPDEKELKERKQGAKWPGKSTRTVFDKLRADFNESSKSAQDRVAQIRLTKEQVPASLLPPLAVSETSEETLEERGKTWNDLMTKVKTLVLFSFDLRVRQYETDVAEQESRRALPGFNFCTFFIHKEGLAKALESIGLVEDALVIYDQLSLGLETVLRDIANGKADGTATTFPVYTNDIKERIVGMKKAQPNGNISYDADVWKSDDNVETSEREYREKIARSSISVFDFVSYLFYRQKALILRLANAKAAHAGREAFIKDGGEDLVLISEVCWRASSFIHNNARTLRQDLQANRSRNAESTLSHADIDSLVCSWTYTVAGRILDETAASALDHQLNKNNRESLGNGALTATRSESELDGKGGISAHPHRMSSLPPRQSRVMELQGRSSLQSASESDLLSTPLSSGMDENRANSAEPGLVELITYRAELVMVRRKMLEQLAKQRGWLAGWALAGADEVSRLEEVDLNTEDDVRTEHSGNNFQTSETASTLLSPTLKSELASERGYHETYERLSDQAMRLFVRSTQTKSAEAIMGDLAILKSQQGDYGYAVSYFQHVLPLYASDGWGLMEAEALKMYARCLKELDRKEDYVKTVLVLLAKACSRKKHNRAFGNNIRAINTDTDAVAGVLPDLVAFSKQLDFAILSPAEYLFSGLKLHREIIHQEGSDGFALTLSFHHLLDDEIPLDEVSARLVHNDDPNLEIWLTSTSSVDLRAGLNECRLESKTHGFGRYLIDRLVLKATRLSFVHEYQQKAESQTDALHNIEENASSFGIEALKYPSVLLYPLHHAFNVDVNLQKTISVNKAKYLDVHLSSGWNEVEEIDLRLKPASAGLRLHLANAKLIDVAWRSEQESSAGQIALQGLAKHSTSKVSIPYTLEHDSPEIFIRFEVRYTTCDGQFIFIASKRLSTQLPVDVNVRDTFHLDALFSNFTIRTIGKSPLALVGAELGGSSLYDVTSPPALAIPMNVFEHQPANLIYRVRRNKSTTMSSANQVVPLALKLRFYAIEELVVENLRTVFAEALEAGPVSRLSRLLVPVLCERCRLLLSKPTLEMGTLFNEVRLPSFEQFGWANVISTLSPPTQRPAMDWLEAWHTSNNRITLEPESVPKDLLQSLAIAVEVPTIDVVHNASISVAPPQREWQRSLQIFGLGQPLEAQLKLSSTTDWSANEVSLSNSNDKAKHAGHSSAFIFDVHAEPESWLVGGQRRGHFTVQDGKEQTFELLLVPLRVGIYPLPLVTVQALPVNESSRDVQSGISCETHNETAGQVVHIIRDERTARAHIPEPSIAAPPSSRPSTATTTEDVG